MLSVIPNQAQPMITDTCAIDIKQILHANLQLQMEMANITDLLPGSFGSDDVPPYMFCT